ncbi:MAG TPA: OmpW family outer membrane protein [Thermoanaerobaculia bacterium]|nr:OmpW family outer membrane protein [Thermoanaerobaculia bacterium]
MKSAAIVALLLLFAGAPLVAQERNIQLTVWASQTEMQGESDFEGGFETDFDDGAALGASANLFLNNRFSVEGSVFGLRSETGLVLDGTPVLDLGKLDLTILSAGAQFHILGQSRFDPYIGAGGAYVIADGFSSGDLQSAGLGRIELDNEFTYYGNVGIGFQITQGFGIVIDARYIPYEPSSRSSATGIEQDLEISPRILSAGLRLQF